MALVPCKGCGRQISSRASICPKCGFAVAAPVRAVTSAGLKESLQVRLAQAAAAASGGCFHDAADPEVPGQAEGVLRQRQILRGAAAAGREPEPEAPQPPPFAPEPPAGAEPPAFRGQPPVPEPVEEWYYIAPAGRQGPVTLKTLQELATRGEIAGSTPVWKAGLPDWVALAESAATRGESRTAGVEPGAGIMVQPRLCAWALALAPVWGLVLQVVVTEAYVALTREKLGYYAELWWLLLLANLLPAGLDLVLLRRAGYRLSGAGNASFLLAPAYLYLRDRKIAGGLLRTCVWIGSFSLALVALFYLNDIYSRLSVG